MIGSWESSGVVTVCPLHKWYHTWLCLADWWTPSETLVDVLFWRRASPLWSEYNNNKSRWNASEKSCSIKYSMLQKSKTFCPLFKILCGELFYVLCSTSITYIYTYIYMYIYIREYVYAFTELLHYKKDAEQTQIQYFPSSRWVPKPKFMRLVCLIIFS